MTDRREDLARALRGLRVPEMDQEAIAEVARREFTASDPDDRIRAVVTGRGELVSLHVSALALRGEARETVGVTVVDVVNAALASADAAMLELRPDSDVRARVGQITAEFNSRLDALMGRLDEIDRSLGS